MMLQFNQLVDVLACVQSEMRRRNLPATRPCVFTVPGNVDLRVSRFAVSAETARRLLERPEDYVWDERIEIPLDSQA